MFKTIIMTALLLGSTAALADVYTPRLDQRQANQTARIQQGVQSGQLTARETTYLVGQQVRSHAMEKTVRSGWTVHGW